MNTLIDDLENIFHEKETIIQMDFTTGFLKTSFNFKKFI